MVNLSASIDINGVVIKNRIVMPPMVCFGWSDESGMVSDRHTAEP
jgi:NADPH2 dehydrogenase